jgi:hypothetical protein
VTHTTRQLRLFLVREGRRTRTWPVCFTAAVAITAMCLVPASASAHAQTPPALSANVPSQVTISSSLAPQYQREWLGQYP